MRATILSAIPAEHPSMGVLAPLVRSRLAEAGYDEVTSFDLTHTKLAFCQGEYDCWVKTPGVCRARDSETEIVDAVHRSDGLVLLGPMKFGGYDHVLKVALDRLLCLLEPFFTRRAALTHHEMRYGRRQSLFSIGWADHADRGAAETFAQLNDANAVNHLATTCGSVVLEDSNRSSWSLALATMFASARRPGWAITDRTPLRRALLEAAAADPAGIAPPRIARAALLVGSPKVKGTSASEAIARALSARLERAGVECELHFATEFVHDTPHSNAVAEAIAARDLFVLVSPLYVDSFPSLTTHALELVSRARAKARAPARLAAIVNCGFPEAEQIRTALRIARHFADASGYGWGGAMPLGGGGAIQPGSKLDEATGRLAHVVRALDLAAPELSGSGRVPQEAIETMAQSAMPDGFYRLVGDLGWRWQAHQNGLAQRDLRAQPLDAPPRR